MTFSSDPLIGRNGLRLLVVGINYAPERTGIAPYTTELAEHYALNHQVRVLTGLPHYPTWAVDPMWRRGRRRREEVNRVEVIRHAHFVPKAQSAISRLVYESTWAATSLPSALSQRPDAVIAVVPALSGAALGALVKLRAHAPLGVIVQDVMSAAATEAGVSGGRMVSGPLARAERALLRNADRIVTIHGALASALQQRLSLREVPTVIPNWSHVRAATDRDAAMLRERSGWGPDLVVLHSGNMGQKQDLDSLAAAARLAAEERVQVRFVLAGGGSQFDRLRTAAEGIAQLEVRPGVSEEEFPALLAAADFLIVNERPGLMTASVPSKLTSYFTSGTPVIAATDAASATAQVVRASQGALLVPPGDPRAVLRAALTLGKLPRLRARFAANAMVYAREHLTRDAALTRYDAFLAELVSNGRR